MNIIIVFISGIFGGLARMEVNDVVPKIGGFPIGTLLINLVGCFFFAFLIKHYFVVKNVHEKVILAVGTGFIGTFTTFSSALIDTVELMNAGHYGLMVLYILLEIGGGFLMIVAGITVGRKFVKA